MCTQFTSWKNSLIFIVFLFVLPCVLMAQDSQRFTQTTTLTKNYSNQPGDILFSQQVTGNYKVLFILVKYPGSSEIVSFLQAQTHANILKARIEGNSYNKTSLTIDITPILILPNPESYYQSLLRIRLPKDAGQKAKQAGFDVDSYDREVIFTKKIWSASPAAYGFNTHTALMSHNLPYVSAHELGHTFDWQHANFWQVSAGSPISPNGTEIRYGDKYDLMGGSSGSPPFTPNDYHHFNPWFKHRVGWIPQESILDVTASGTYTIQALDSDPQTGGSVTKYTALKIRKDPLTDYWIFFRRLEEFINYGPVITLIRNTNFLPTLLLDMTPGSQSDDWRDAALAVGQTFSDSQAGMSVKTLSTSSSDLQVEVTVDPNIQAGIDNLPVIDVVSPASGGIIRGVVDYQVTAFDPDIGTTNGAGIDKVKIFFHRLNDALIVNVRQGLDPPSPDATMEFSAPPYRWQFDTNSGSPLILDGQYNVVVKATSIQGNTKMVWCEHLVDNNGMPVTPVLSSPADNSTNIPTTPNLVWNFSNGATSYRLQVSTVSDFSTTVVDQNSLTSTSFQVSSLSTGTTHYWRVNATNTVGTSGWSPAWQFSTAVAGSAPTAPALSSPADNATGISTNFSLVWNTSSGATSYQLQVSTVSDFLTTFIDQSGITSTIYQINGLLNNTSYYWRVNASNASGASPYSTARQFTTIVSAPAAPALSSPADNATDISTTPNLVWNASSGATSYDVQVSTQSNFATLEVDQSGLSVTSLQATGLSNSTTHYWRVRAANAGSTSAWSSVRHFTTIVAAPAAPVLSSPANNAIDIAIDTTLVWSSSAGAVSYGLQISKISDFSTTVVDQGGLTETLFQVNGLANETTYSWRVNAKNAGGTSPWSSVWQFTTELVSSVETGSEIPGDFRLGQNYPNPFNPTTNITFDLPKSEFVSLKIYNLLGTEVATLVSENLSAGKYTIKFDASSLSSGVFFYKLQTTSFIETRKMLLVR